jgi:3',5'-nucleoside bisphosphate phosphatase
MNLFRADMHIHTLLSPCGDLEMSPANIIACAKKRKLDIVGITDHNSTHHCALMQKLGTENGIFVLTGAEITTREEVHCLAYFESPDTVSEFQLYINAHLPYIQNDPQNFGYQVVVDEHEDIVQEIDSLLIVGLDQSIEEVQRKVRELGGLFIPAHVDRPRFGILSQLGFMPDDILPDAIEFAQSATPEKFRIDHPEFNTYQLVSNSDAHCPDQIGIRYSIFDIEKPSFKEIKMALHGENGRKVLVA